MCIKGTARFICSMRSKPLKPFDFSAFIHGTDIMKTEQTTAERMCYIVNDKDLSQQAKDFLNQISRLDALINRLLNTVATERSRLTSIGCELKQDKVQTSGPKNSLEETICKIDELERTINARIDELVDLKNTTMKAIQSLPDFDQQNVLIARYIDGKKWLDIAFDLNFSISQVYKIHGKALISFSEKNPNLLLSLEQ
jgi:DNA-directed RNA polymerase specialized sigma subunit